jgi:hypothetical protein
MRSLRKLLLVGVGVLALHGLQACASESDLNPQPLPPQGGEETPNPTPPVDKTGDNTSGGSSGSSGSSGSPAAAVDGGSDGAADGGDAGEGGDH